MIDTHSHPQMRQYDSDREGVIKRALDGGVKMICVGVDFETSKQAVELAEKYDGIWASVGLHPNDNLDEKYEEEPYKKLAESLKVVAIGEVGLDYYRTKKEGEQQFQKQRFLEQISLAIRLNKPLIIHCRNGSTPFDKIQDKPLTTSAHEDMINILSQNPDARGVIHSFTGTWEDAQKYLKLGFYIGLNGIITFADQYNETVIRAPVDRILLETDAPFLSPVPYRGKRNEPGRVLYVARRIAELKKLPVEEVEKVTDQNASDLFGI